MFNQLLRAGLILLLVFSGSPQSSAQKDESKLRIRRGKPIVVDGAIQPGEWDDADRLHLQVAKDWVVEVRYKHDGTNFVLAFSGLTKAGRDPARPDSRFPELLIDPQNGKSAAWQKGQWWLHTSFNDCEGNGEPNVYRRDGKFMCAKEKPGWQANNFPLEIPGIVEMQVSFEKLGIQPGGKAIGLALNVTDTSAIWTFWPERARLESPATWGEAVIVP